MTAFFAVWIAATFFGGILGFALGWMPAFLIAIGLAYFADWLVLIGVLATMTVYVINHV